MPRYGREVLSCLHKARESALQAVEVYNKPAIPFKSGGYIVLMIIAWTALFHSIFLRRKIKPFFRKPNSVRFQRVDGDRKWWDLAECLHQYFGSDNTPVRKNLELFVKLRNKIEHRSMPELDPAIFGRCQALLLNFDDFLAAEFGEQQRLRENLCFALQFASAKPAGRLARPSAGWSDVAKFIHDYRASLGSDIQQSQEYCWQVYLLPRIGNHRSSADVAIEWVPYDPAKPEEMEQYNRVAGLIRNRQVFVQNLGQYKPAAVSRMAEQAIGKRFSASRHHARAWQHFRVRPPRDAADPTACDNRYCSYDEAHADYVYTQAWVDKLIEFFGVPSNYEALFGGGAVSTKPSGG